MAKSNKIRYSRKDESVLNKLVKNFNAKITRFEKKGDSSYLPSRITKKELKQKIETRKDFNRVVKSYSRFLKLGAEKKVTTSKGIVTTKWRKKEYEIAKAQATRKLNKRKKEINASEYKGNTRLINDLNLNVSFDNIDEILPADFEPAFRRIEKRLRENYNYEQDKRYKENYIKAIRDSLGSDVAWIIENKIKNISLEEFARIYYDDPILEIDYIYDPVEAEQKAINIIDKLTELGY